MSPLKSIRRTTLELLVAFVVLIVAPPTLLLAGFDIDIVYDNAADFSAFKTYRWKTAPSDNPTEAAMVDKRITTTADVELAKKGLRRAAEGEAPDLLITYYGGIDDNLLIEGVRYELAPHVVWTGADPLAVTHRYEVGTLGIDFADAKTEKIVWSGIVQAKAATGRQLRSKIEKAVQKVLKRYPPD